MTDLCKSSITCSVIKSILHLSWDRNTYTLINFFYFTFVLISFGSTLPLLKVKLFQSFVFWKASQVCALSYLKHVVLRVTWKTFHDADNWSLIRSFFLKEYLFQALYERPDKLRLSSSWLINIYCSVKELGTILKIQLQGISFRTHRTTHF